jgi:hypothetical protein
MSGVWNLVWAVIIVVVGVLLYPTMVDVMDSFHTVLLGTMGTMPDMTELFFDFAPITILMLIGLFAFIKLNGMGRS